MARSSLLRLASWNVNGIRAAGRKGFVRWLAATRPDVLCLQEAKAKPEQVGPELREPEGYHAFWNPAERPGYSGVVTFSRVEPFSVERGIGVPRFDREGRVVVTRHPGFDLYNVYFPNGKQSPERLAYKMDFCKELLKRLDAERDAGRRLVVCGDYNTAHREIDLAHPKQNARVSGFLPEERAWLDSLVEHGFVDTFRMFHAEPEQYTWWSPLTRARERNVGWRIDCFFVSRDLASQVRNAFISPEVMGSDHCPVGLELQV
jgi:exodeoxyribonuclease III